MSTSTTPAGQQHLLTAHKLAFDIAQRIAMVANTQPGPDRAAMIAKLTLDVDSITAKLQLAQDAEADEG